MKTKLPLVAVVGGVALLLLSFVWGLIFSPQRTWTPEKSEMVSHLSAQVQKLHMKVTLGERNPAAYGDSDPAEVKSEYEATKQKLEALKAEFQNVTESPKSVATLLRWAGLASVLVGLVAMRTQGS